MTFSTRTSFLLAAFAGCTVAAACGGTSDTGGGNSSGLPGDGDGDGDNGGDGDGDSSMGGDNNRPGDGDGDNPGDGDGDNPGDGDGDNPGDGDGDTGTPLCEARKIDACLGQDGCLGLQQCNDDGTAWGPCSCDDGGTGGMGTGGMGSGGMGTGGMGTGVMGTGGMGTGGTTSVCTADEYRCDGADLEQCSDDETAWESVETCITSGLCNASGGQCDAPACSPAEQSCEGTKDTVYECNAERTGFSQVATCVGTNVECSDDVNVSECLDPKLNYECNANDRWIHRTESSFNVQGWLQDSHGTGSSLTTLTTCDLTVNWTAVAGQHDGSNSATHWGTEIGVRLCEASASDPNPGTVYSTSTCPLAGDQDKVTGVKFTFCGNGAAYPDEIRLGFPEAEGPGAYKIIDNPAPGQTHTVNMLDADVRVHWEAIPSPSDPSNVTTIAWNVPSEQDVDQNFSVCITDIEFLGAL